MQKFRWSISRVNDFIVKLGLRFTIKLALEEEELEDLRKSPTWEELCSMRRNLLPVLLLTIPDEDRVQVVKDVLESDGISIHFGYLSICLLPSDLEIICEATITQAQETIRAAADDDCKEVVSYVTNQTEFRGEIPSIQDNLKRLRASEDLEIS